MESLNPTGHVIEPNSRKSSVSEARIYKEGPATMNAFYPLHPVAGIDVSKHTLDIAVRGVPIDIPLQKTERLVPYTGTIPDGLRSI